MPSQTYLAVGQIAEKLGVPVHRVTYIIRTRGMTASFKAGVSRVFDERTVRRIAGEFKSMKGVE